MINMNLAFNTTPQASALIRGSSDYPYIKGVVNFFQTDDGVIVVADINGLPYKSGSCGGSVLGFHIHSGNSCTGTESDPFADAMTHYNPNGCPHPFHKGDMPPLFVCHGRAFMAFLTDRITADEIRGKTIIIHSAADDFTTQPSGNSGNKIACGTVE